MVQPPILRDRQDRCEIDCHWEAQCLSISHRLLCKALTSNRDRTSAGVGKFSSSKRPIPRRMPQVWSAAFQQPRDYFPHVPRPHFRLWSLASALGIQAQVDPEPRPSTRLVPVEHLCSRASSPLRDWQRRARAPIVSRLPTCRKSSEDSSSLLARWS